MWILRILGPIKFYKGPIKVSNGPLKFEYLHVFEWDMGHWPILRAHHHFGLGLTLGGGGGGPDCQSHPLDLHMILNLKWTLGHADI